MAKRATTMSEQWMRLMGTAQARWSRLSTDDLQGVHGNAERLISVLQARYGFGRGQALDELKAWRRSLTAGAAA